MYWMLLAATLAQDSSDRALALAWAHAHQAHDHQAPAPAPKVRNLPRQDYAAGKAAALASGRPLVLWVACDPSFDGEAVHAVLGAFEGDSTPRVVVAVPARGALWGMDSLPPGVTADVVRLTASRTRAAVPMPQPSAVTLARVSRSGGGCST